ncbi:phosphoserine transaminase [Demequina zhanjiangensis]|uniref:phosphoserine transaminase n=1 Tax=Demequina zhanjiangensis TaxID=3051659 RepID=A0ABT8FYM9_9MICO|nr:phosphoserine transaminase [Demequina sp. SYSU T00b26]MDN4471947.1 phosphoserine transaminase [Demequina sp. SYSU T00b26]
MSDSLTIPSDLLPRDGRFGSGPSKVSGFQIEALKAAESMLLGTSHRQAPVKNLVGDIRQMLASFFSLPDGYEVVLGNGGSTLLWDAAAYALVQRRAQHSVHGEFGSKFAAATLGAPHLDASSILQADAGSIATPELEEGIDVYAWPHNETSTGAIAPVTRLRGADGALMVVDGTSAAGGTELDVSQTDVYYFAPQKNFASDGGLWFALMSPAAIERVERIAASDRYIPSILSLQDAVANSRQNQTLNTPAIATLVMMRAQLEWLMSNGGMAFAASRTADSASRLYTWAERSELARPFVGSAPHRSPVVGTIDLDASVDSAQLRAVLRANGVVDVDPYRKLGRNQIRVGMFPAVDPEDVSRLTASIDWVLERLVD